LQRLRTMHLFAGAGGGILADVLLGHQPVCAVEINNYCQQVLAQRQKDGCLPWFPIYDDVTKFDGKPWRGIVDVVSGGFPCQDISAAGKGAGLDGARSGLWSHFARIIGEVRPKHVFVENSPILTSRGLGRVLGDLAAMGFDAKWGVISAADTGAPHLRERIWIVANACCGRLSESEERQMEQPWRAEVIGASNDDSDANSLREPQSARRQSDKRDGAIDFCKTIPNPNGGREEQNNMLRGLGWKRGQEGNGNHDRSRGNVWPAEPGVGRMAHGVAHRSDRLKAIGNGQVSRVAATAWEILK
jgi:DNA (cytosine-5)-methyltransferase 1